MSAPGSACWILVFVAVSAALRTEPEPGLFPGLLPVWSSAAGSVRRQLSVYLNPGAPSPPPGGDLLHISAVGTNDTLHFLFCSLGAPTLLLVQSNTTSSTVRVNWTQFLDRGSDGGVWVEPESSVQHSSALIFSRLFEYDDVNDTASASSDVFPPFDLQEVTWQRLHLSGGDALLCSAASSFNNGSLCLQLSVFEEEGRGLAWPRLLHSADTSQLRMWIDGLMPQAPHSRFLVELQAVGGASLNRVEVTRSIDDEFTPSIFQVSRWVPEVNSSVPVFVQWKPVGYRRAVPALEDATPCHHSAPRQLRSEDALNASVLIRGFYPEPLTTALNLSFGLAGEPFYNSTRFLSWTVLLGSGSPPLDSFSPLVLGVMAVGLGAPMMLLVLGAICVCVKKKTAATAASYQPIN